MSNTINIIIGQEGTMNLEQMIVNHSGAYTFWCEASYEGETVTPDPAGYTLSINDQTFTEGNGLSVTVIETGFIIAWAKPKNLFVDEGKTYAGLLKNVTDEEQYWMYINLIAIT